MEADVDFKVVRDLIERIRARAVQLDVLESISAAQHVSTVVYEELIALMGEPAPLAIAPKPPTVILMAGLQGSGKTTTTVKLARRLKDSHNPLVVACDLRRPAAVEQLRILAEQSKVAFFGPADGGQDVLKVVREAADYAASRLHDVILLDTAGRLHVDRELMEELGAVAEPTPQNAVSAPEPLNSASEPLNESPTVVPEVVSEMEAPRPEPEAVGPSAAVVTDSQDGRPVGGGDTRAASAAPDDRALIPSFAALHFHQPKLGDILVQAGVIDESQLVRALQIQQASKDDKRKLGEVLVSEKFITETRLAEALSTQLKLPLFTLTRYRPMPEAIRLVPRAVAERLSLIPLSIMEDDLLLVAMSNPLDLLGQDEVRMLTGRNLKVGIATASDINQNLDRLYNLQNNLEEAIEEVDTDLGQNLELDFDASSDEAPVIQLVSNLLQQAVREGASDIHVEVYEKMARVRFRVDGQLYSAFDYPVALHPSVSARLKIMSGMDIAEKRKPQDGRILIRVDGRRIDLRVSVLPTMNGEKVVLRILDQESSSVGLDRLGLEADDMEKIDLFCNMPWGIMLVTGPTGSGKSTTLYSMLQKINQPDVNIITVEDPVEFSVAGINQVHVNEKAGLTFESALRSILRQDPDKVMVGEIRDQKTAQIAIRAALTGHFVLSTLHTNDAPSAATRMVDMGVPPFLVSASLSGVIAQRLVRRLCPICREEYELNENMCETLNVPVGTHAFRPRGCNECRNGYKGRRGIYEIMMVDDELRRMILEGVSNIQLRAEAIKRGMKTLRQSGINNALAGHTSLEEVFTTTL